jgi:hypothetical protein
MAIAASYLERAEECRRRAAEAKLPPDQLHWDKLARAWLKLAEAEDVPTALSPSGSQKPVHG